MRRYTIDPESSAVIIEARSSVGPIAWEGLGATGTFSLALEAGEIDFGVPPTGFLELQMTSLTSGNRVYDAELMRRIDAKLHPKARVELLAAAPNDDTSVIAKGRLEFHGVARELSGTLKVEPLDDGRVLVTGDHVVDIRDFGLPPPTMLMLKIYPDVRVALVVSARPA